MVAFKFSLVADRCYIYKKAKWLSEKALHIAEERREAKSKGEMEKVYPTKCRVPDNSKKRQQGILQ